MFRLPLPAHRPHRPRRWLGWLAFTAYAWSLLATNIGLTISAIALLGPHDVELRTRGQEVLFVLHHREAAAPAEAASPPAHETGSRCGSSLDVAEHAADHEVLQPAETDSSRRGAGEELRASFADSALSGPEPARLAFPRLAGRLVLAGGGADARAGPPLGLRTTELRI